MKNMKNEIEKKAVECGFEVKKNKKKENCLSHTILMAFADKEIPLIINKNESRRSVLNKLSDLASRYAYTEAGDSLGTLYFKVMGQN